MFKGQIVYYNKIKESGLIETENGELVYLKYNQNEQSELNAIDPYGKSKVQAEKLVFQWCTENNVTCTILRLPLVSMYATISSPAL